MKHVRRLFECRSCGGLVATKLPACPYCEETDGGTKTVRSLKTGEPVEITRSLYEKVKFEGLA